MSVIVLVLGLLAVGAGFAALGTGVPIYESALGQALVIAGAAGLAGGLILIGLAAVVGQLRRLNETLRTRPLADAPRAAEPQLRADIVPQRTESVPARPELPSRLEPPPPRAELPPRVPFAPELRVPELRVPDLRAAEPRAPELRAPEPPTPEQRVPEPRAPEPRVPEPRAPEPRPPEPRLRDLTGDSSPSAVPRQRPSIPRPDRVVPDAEEVPLSPNGVAGQTVPEPAPEPAPPAPAAPTEVETAREPRLDFLFRSRPTRTPPDSFESLWPKGQGRQKEMQPGTHNTPPPAAAPVSGDAPTAADVQTRSVPSAPPSAENRSVAILKSGVVDGMAYTLYTDGSIEAQLPQGTVRFNSIAELRAHIESNS
jgi:hypothetical protein